MSHGPAMDENRRLGIGWLMSSHSSDEIEHNLCVAFLIWQFGTSFVRPLRKMEMGDGMMVIGTRLKRMMNYFSMFKRKAKEQNDY